MRLFVITSLIIINLFTIAHAGNDPNLDAACIRLNTVKKYIVVADTVCVGVNPIVDPNYVFDPTKDPVVVPVETIRLTIIPGEPDRIESGFWSTLTISQADLLSLIDPSTALARMMNSGWLWYNVNDPDYYPTVIPGHPYDITGITAVEYYDPAPIGSHWSDAIYHHDFTAYVGETPLYLSFHCPVGGPLSSATTYDCERIPAANATDYHGCQLLPFSNYGLYDGSFTVRNTPLGEYCTQNVYVHWWGNTLDQTIPAVKQIPPDPDPPDIIKAKSNLMMYMPLLFDSDKATIKPMNPLFLPFDYLWSNVPVYSPSDVMRALIRDNMKITLNSFYDFNKNIVDNFTMYNQLQYAFVGDPDISFEFHDKYYSVSLEEWEPVYAGIKTCLILIATGYAVAIIFRNKGRF